MTDKDVRQNEYIVLSNKLVEGRYSLSQNETKLLFLILSQINVYDKELKTYRVYMKDVKKHIYDNKQMYVECRKITKRLMSKVLEFDYEEDTLEDGETMCIQTGWLSSVRYYKNKGYFDCRIDNILHPYLIQLRKQFTKIDLQIILSCKNKYSVRIYQLLKQYHTIGYRVINLDDLRNKFRLGKRHNLYTNIRRDIIIPSLKEIHKHSNLEVKHETIKEGKKVVSVKFYIKERRQKTLFDVDVDKIKYEKDIIDVKPLTDKEVEDEKQERIFKKVGDLVKDKIDTLTTDEVNKLIVSFREYIKDTNPFLVKYVEDNVDYFDNTIISGDWILFLQDRILTQEDLDGLEDT